MYNNINAISTFVDNTIINNIILSILYIYHQYTNSVTNHMIHITYTQYNTV